MTAPDSKTRTETCVVVFDATCAETDLALDLATREATYTAVNDKASAEISNAICDALFAATDRAHILLAEIGGDA